MTTCRNKTVLHSHELPLIVITGFMGTGKTETARELSKLTGLELIDTDTLVERLAGRSISEIILSHGEKHFRDLEATVCKRLYKKRGAVIATGGGTLLNEAIFRGFAGLGTMVLLQASIDSLLERLSADGSRPLLETKSQDKDELRERIRFILKQREKVYGRIPFRIDTSSIMPKVAACRIAAKIELPSAIYYIGERPDNSGRSGAIIEAGRGILSKIGERLKKHGLAETVVLLMPQTVKKHFFPQIKESLDAAGISSHLIEIEDGEHRKTLANASLIIEKIVDTGAGRDAAIIPVGGGVTGDIGGFVASIYMRGVNLVHVPTTLLAQVDSSIGGKTGVNLPRAKNLIGSFYQPDLVLSDPCTLRTLPHREISNGMAEVIKTAIIGSGELFEFIESRLADTGDRTLRSVDFLERCVSHCVAIKGAIVEEDPYENDKRRVLNLGHTVGHAIEAACEYRLNHGQAVSLGLIAALRIAIARGIVEKLVLDRTINLLKRCRLPVAFPRFDEEALARSLHLDKKRKNKRLHFVLPTGIGRVRIVDDVTADEIRAAISKGRR